MKHVVWPLGKKSKIGEVLQHLAEEPKIEARHLGKKSMTCEVLEHLGDEPRIEARRLGKKPTTAVSSRSDNEGDSILFNNCSADIVLVRETVRQAQDRVLVSRPQCRGETEA